MDDDSIRASRPPKPVDKILADANPHSSSNHLLQLLPQIQILLLLHPMIIQERKDNAAPRCGSDSVVFLTSGIYYCWLSSMVDVVVGVVDQSIDLKWTIRRCLTFLPLVVVDAGKRQSRRDFPVERPPFVTVRIGSK